MAADTAAPEPSYVTAERGSKIKQQCVNEMKKKCEINIPHQGGESIADRSSKSTFVKSACIVNFRPTTLLQHIGITFQQYIWPLL